MKKILAYTGSYIFHVNKKLLLVCTLLTAVLVFLNYHNNLENRLSRTQAIPWPEYSGHYILFATAFFIPYLFTCLIEKKNFFRNKLFIVLLVLAPAIFSLKMAIYPKIPFSYSAGWNEYWNRIYYWPVNVIIIWALIYLVWALVEYEQPFYGSSKKGFDWKPYWMMLICMLPLIVFAATRPDFLVTYPKIKSVLHLSQSFNLSWFHKLLFELSYGSDFFSIEIFFRGFLILAFIKWVGKDAILPMACFYCTIHFGKPLGECISSYFGGLFLGIVVYNTKSIYGGLVVHLGIAWAMEIAAYLVTIWK